MKVALVHDYLNQYGGAERVLDELKLLYPKAPVYTSIYDPNRMPSRYREWDIRTSWLNKVPGAYLQHRVLLAFLPQAFESFDLSEYDLVLSSSSGFAHGVLTGAATVHICYYHSPPRFLWDYHNYADRERLNAAARILAATRLTSLRTWDRVAADRADARISASRIVQQRIRKHYGQTSVIIPPPVDTSRFIVAEGEGSYFLMLMRLVGWKRPDIVIESCTRLGLPLVVAGDGRDLRMLRRIAGPTIRFVGRVDDEQMKTLYRDCKALILPSEEDFGITSIEAMSAGRPVIAYGRGGVLDTVKPGVTGVFFEEQSAASVGDALMKFEGVRFNPTTIRRHAATFDREIFRTRVRRFIAEVMAEYNGISGVMQFGHPEAAR
jgi:glycosyltransferase involved in cell wall biosynthesis